MKRLIISFFLIVSIFTSFSQIQKDTVTLQECEVTSSPNPVLFRNISRTVHVISKEQIKSAPIVAIDDLLRIYGGIDIRSRGAMGVQSDINLGGGTFDQGLIMINGISLNDPQTGHHNLNQAIDLDDIEKIEIFEGAGARWFGVNSFSGGINIISKNPEKKTLSMSLSGGMYGYLSGKAGYSYKTGKVQNRTSAGISRSDGFLQNTDFRVINLNHSSYYKSKYGKIIVNLGLLDKGFGANSFYTPKYPDQYEHIKTWFSSATFETGEKIKFKSNVSWRRNYDRFELFREDVSWYEKHGDYFINGVDTAGFPTPNGLYPYKGHNYHRTDIIGAATGTRFSSFLGSTSLNIDYKLEKIVSNVLGDPMTDTIFTGSYFGYYTKAKARNNLNIAFNQHYSSGSFSVSAGILMYYNEDYGIHFSPGIDLGYLLTKNIKIHASVNKALRLPTFTDLYYQGPSNISNPDLYPERSTNTEVGLKWFSDGFNTSLSGQYRKGNNIIDWIKYSPEEKWQSANLTSMETYGISFSANKQFKKGAFQYLGIKYSWLNSDKQNKEFISLYALDFLRHNMNMFLSHNIINNLIATWTFSLQKRNGSYIDYNTGVETNYQNVLLLNLKLVYTVKKIEFSISGSNLLNRQYYDIGNVQQPGIWIIGGFKLRLFEESK